MQIKRCTKCGIEKSVDEFSKNSRSKDGLRSQCKACVKIYQQDNKTEIAAYKKQHQQDNKVELAAKKKRYYQKHRVELVARQKQYYQDNKIEIAAQMKKYQQDNKIKIAVYGKQYRQGHKIKIAAQNKVYRQEHKAEIAAWRQTKAGKNASRKADSKRRALKLGAVIKDFDRQKILERDGYVCQHCGKKTRPDYNCYHPLYPHGDHIVPLSKGGDHSMQNGQCLCHYCNLKKHNNQLDDQLRIF